jgi:tetratricopeptide (TPR) repeat protein
VEQRFVFIRILAIVVSCASLLAAPARALAPQDGLGHLGAGLRLFELQRYSEAAREFELALEINPKLDDARYHLAVSYFNQRRYADARKQFERLRATGYRKDWATYYFGRMDLLEGSPDRAIQQFESLKGPGPLEDELYFLGSAYMKRGEPEKATGPLKRQTEFNPRDFRAHNLLGRAYTKMGHPREAEREYARAEQLQEYYLKGKKELMECRALLEAAHREQAWARCGSVVETDDIDKLTAVGMLFGEFHSYDRALQVFEKALALDPESPEVNYDIGFTYFGKKDYPQARKFLETAVQLRAHFFEAQALEGTVLYLLGDDAAALKALQQAHELRPDDDAVSKLLAKLQGAKGEIK